MALMKRVYNEGAKFKKIIVMESHQNRIISFGKDLKEAFDILIGYYKNFDYKSY